MNSIHEDQSAEMLELLRVAAERKKLPNHERNVKPAGGEVASIVASFDEMIKAAPEKPEPIIEAIPANLVRAANGWGERYTREIALTGDQWHAAFADVSALVRGGALVALLQDRGTGKTQMAAEVARGGLWPNDAGEWDGNMMVTGKTALYRRLIDIYLDLGDARKDPDAPSEKRVIRKMETCGLLVIDEFQEAGGTDREKAIVTNLLDKRYSAKKPTIIIANFTRGELAKSLNASVRDRMHENGKSFTFDWPSYRRARS